MSETRHIAESMALFVAVGSPERLNGACLQMAAFMQWNWEAAKQGKPQPTGEAVIGIGTERDMRAQLAALVGQKKLGRYVVEYSPVLDAARVSEASEVEGRGKLAFLNGKPDPEGWYPVAVGDRFHAEKEATRLRKVRAGHRSLVGKK